MVFGIRGAETSSRVSDGILPIHPQKPEKVLPHGYPGNPGIVEVPRVGKVSRSKRQMMIPHICAENGFEARLLRPMHVRLGVVSHEDNVTGFHPEVPDEGLECPGMRLPVTDLAGYDDGVEEAREPQVVQYGSGRRCVGEIG